MSQALPHVSLGSSRLVRFLTDLSADATRVSHRQFTQRLGQLIDLSDSVNLSRAHAHKLCTPTADPGGFREEITAEFLRARSSIIQVAMRSFFPPAADLQGTRLSGTRLSGTRLSGTRLSGTRQSGTPQPGSAHSRIKWPAPETPPPTAAEPAAVPYLKFYSRQQLDVESRIRGLHLRSRAAVAPLSDTLARICAIDAALGDALNQHARRCFGAIPRLLEERLAHLFRGYEEQVRQGAERDRAWRDTRELLRREMQGLLLAEIEARLLPALGLIEALNEEIPHED